MKNTIITIPILLWFCILTSCSQNKNCKDFKTGKFKLIENKSNTEYLIDRSDAIQTETNLKTLQLAKFKITWESDCKYTLTIIEARQEVMDFYKNKSLNMEIIEIYDDGYKFSAKLDGFDLVKYQILKRIE
jgi:hypothetical protein